MNKLIIYELNELPRKLLDYYISLKPNSNLSNFKKHGKDLNTFTTDKGELHPWTTWPTFYRGVDNTVHGITSLNQNIECEKEYPPVWKFLIKNNISIGIFGSLQSYPPLSSKKVKFYLPDTFAPDYKSYPKILEKFQKFNLKLVSKNSGQIRSIKLTEIIYFLECILNKSIGINSFLKVLRHLINEKINKNFKKRRSLLQTELSFDLFIKSLKKQRPEFSTYFTNHLAGMMHYYWLDVFPMDFKNPYRDPDLFNKNSVIKALDIADKQIGLLMSFAQENSYQLWIASSMGQEAIERKDFARIFIKDFNKIFNLLKLDKSLYKVLPSMYPDINIESNSKKNIDTLIKKFLEIKSLNKKSFFSVRYRKDLNKVNLIYRPHDQNKKYLIYAGEKVNIKDIGFEYGTFQKGTGYHSPKGILLTLGDKSNDIFDADEVIDTKNIFSKIIELFELKKNK